MTRIPSPHLADLRARYARSEFSDVVLRCEDVLATSPGQSDIMEILALALSRLGHEAEGLAVLEQAHRFSPEDSQLSYNLAVTYQGIGDNERAMLRYRDCLRINPDHLDALWNYGELLRVNDYFEDALDCFERMMGAGAEYPDIQHRLAVCYGHLGRDREADASFQNALSGNSTDPALTHWEYAHFLLQKGDYKNGWLHYDHRFETTHKTSVTCHPFPIPSWNGEPLEGKTVLIHGEQGLGDEMMFCSVAPELIDEARHVIIACQPPLVRVFAQSFPKCAVLPHRAVVQPAAIDAHRKIDYAVAMGSLCRHRRNDLAEFASSNRGYLRANGRDQAYFSKLIRQYAPKSTGKLKVGLMWGSNPAHGVPWGARRAGKKSIPAVLLEQLNASNIQFISLQNRDNGGESAWAPKLGMLDFQDDLNDLADTAALIANLDLVISVDTSIAHLAGAMGTPAWILLMKSCDWRWGREGEQTPWYASARLFRQSVQGDWTPVLETVARELLAFSDQADDDAATLQSDATA